MSGGVVEDGHEKVISKQGVGGNVVPWTVLEDNKGWEAQKVTLVASTDTIVTFIREVRLVHVKNWSTSKRLLVKDDVIANDTDATANYIGLAPATDIDNDDWFPYTTSSIHLRAAGASEVTVIGFYA